ncbi:MAG TPA: poly-gamma-glutamate hydrolase family protein [Ilumatobacter sp.]
MTEPTYAELLAMPGVVEQSDLRGSFGFMAYHGGALEVTTDVIARQAARRCGASYYGVLQPESLQLHFPSITVTPDESRTLRSFLEHVDTVVTIHGFHRITMRTSILLGGRNRELAAHIAGHLRVALPQYDAIDALKKIPIELQGLHERNPVNVPRHAGVQVELPPRARGVGSFWADHKGDSLVPHTRALIDGLVAAVNEWTAADTARQ